MYLPRVKFVKRQSSDKKKKNWWIKDKSAMYQNNNWIETTEQNDAHNKL